MPCPKPLVATILTMVLSLSGDEASPYPEAGRGVVELLRSADVVLLGERHWSRHDADLRNALVSDPEFASVSGTVLVEFGNSLYQDILDRYLIDLDSVPDAELYKVWRSTTTTSGAWDSPLYEEFYRTVRTVNETRPRESRVRVVAMGLPVDWDRVEVWEDLLLYGHRGWWFTRMIEREALTPGKKAVVIVGTGHFMRVDDEMDEDYNVVRRLEALHSDKSIRVVLPFALKDGSPGRIPDAVGRTDGPVLLPASAEPFGAWSSDEFFYGGVGPLRYQADGLIYYGPDPDQEVGIPEDYYKGHPAYAAELERRRSLKPRLPGSYN